MWILVVVLIVMLGLYAYTILWTGGWLHKKGQPLLDALFGHKETDDQDTGK
jgi:hypothetical protein